MQSPTPAAPSPAPRSFAGLLADFAAPAKKFPPERDINRAEDGLADDVATLSYEHALRSQARYRPVDEPILRQPVAPQVAEPTALEQMAFDSGDFGQQKPRPAGAPVRGRKCASVTVRLTQPEDEQLRQRSAEAGMTVSAYLRSCAFEVEDLRAQVKQTLAELKRKTSETAEPHKKATWWHRVWPHRRESAA
jgi:hypothetical protein